MLLAEVCAFLAAEGLGTINDDLFMAAMPNHVDACGVVYETGGTGPDLALGTPRIRFENPVIQIVFRGAPNDYEGPRIKAQTAFESMVEIKTDQLLSGTKYAMVIPLQQPFPLDSKPDENKRWRIVCNYLIAKEAS